MDCPKCKAPVADKWAYCPFCGRKLSATTTTTKRKPHRANGEGTVYKRGNTWTVCYRQFCGGKLAIYRTKAGFTTQREAREYLPILKSMDAPPEVYTVQQLWDAFVNSRRWEPLGKNTKVHFRTAFRRLESIHHRDVTTLRFAEIQDMIDNVDPDKFDVDTGYYPKKDVKNVVLKILEEAARNEAVPTTKIELFKLLELPPKTPLAPRDARTLEEMQAIWHVWDTERRPIAGYALIMAYTGMRTGELWQQDINKIDLTRRVMIGGIKTAAGKNREIPIANAVLPVLQELLPTARHGILSYTDWEYLYADWARLIQDTGIRKLDLYCQRHTCKTRLEELVPAVSPAVINAILGHSNGKAVDNIYTHIGLDAKLAAVDRLKLK